MRIYRTSAIDYRQHPNAKDREWTPPEDTIICHHVYSVDVNSPEQKEYILRTLLVPSESNGRNGAFFVVIAYFGGRTKNKRNQVKYVSSFFHTNEIMQGAYQIAKSHMMSETQRRRSRGYDITLDHEIGASSNVLMYNYPLNADNIRMADEAVEQSEEESQPQAPIQPPTHEERINNILKNTDNEQQIKQIMREFPSWPQEEVEAMLTGENLIIFSNLASDAIMGSGWFGIGDDMFNTIINYPSEILSRLSLSEAANKKIQDFKNYVDTMPKVPFLRKRF